MKLINYSNFKKMNEFFIYLDINTITEYKKSNGMLNIIFASIDFIFIIISAIKLSSVDDHIKQLKSKLFSILIIDIFFRIFHIYIFNIFDINLFHDILNNAIATLEFYLIVSLFTDVLTVLRINYEINIFMLSIIFLLLIFPFGRFLPNNPISSDFFMKILKILMILGQSVFSIIFIYILYNIFKNKVSNVVNLIIKEDEDSNPSNEFIHKIIYGSPLSISLLFALYYIFKIYFLFVREPLILFYGTMALNIMYNGALYFAFMICYIVVYSLNRISSLKGKQIKNIEEEVRIINNM